MLPNEAELIALNVRIKWLDISLETLAKLAHTSEPTLRRQLNGAAKPNQELREKVFQILISLLNLKRVCAPVPVSMDITDAESLNNVLIWIDKHKLEVKINLDESLVARVDEIRSTIDAGVNALSGACASLGAE